MKHASHPNKETRRNAGFLMKMIVDRAETLFAEMEGAPDITPAQCRVLLYLESRRGGGEAMSQRVIERHPPGSQIGQYDCTQSTIKNNLGNIIYCQQLLIAISVKL